ncbi:MAG: 4-alpha-glucanotransferase [Kofleriaceae bacterium]
MKRTSIAEGLARLGVRRLLLAIHDVSFPSDLDEDTGRGSPATKAAARLFAYAKSLGFTGIQLGPQGQTSRSNPSPYDSTIFGRHVGNIAIHSLRPGGALERLVSEEEIDRVLSRWTRARARKARESIDASDVGKLMAHELAEMQREIVEARKAVAVAIADEKRLELQYSAARVARDEALARERLQRWHAQSQSVEQQQTALRILARDIQRVKHQIRTLVDQSNRATESPGDGDSLEQLHQHFLAAHRQFAEARKAAALAREILREAKARAIEAPRGTPEHDANAATLAEESVTYQKAVDYIDELLRLNEEAAQMMATVHPGAPARIALGPDAVPDGNMGARHREAHDAMRSLVETAWRAYRAKARPDLVAPFEAFRAANASWLEREALYLAICAENGGSGFRGWPERERDLWLRADPVILSVLIRKHADAIERHAFGQFLVHEEHRRVCAEAERIGLALYGDLQVGYADADAWAYAPVFRRDYAMGAPPSRTNPEGQPWGYPVLDPAQYGGAARDLVIARAEKMFAEYDSIRIDHPHGLVCPWVYRADDADPASAVRAGARLFESPDLADHPALAQLAIARADQIDRAQPRYADRWVRALDAAQVDRYATLFDALVECARRHGRDASDLSCEVLSTMPTPLEAVLARYDLGRWRITQKASLDDPSDVYRAENAQRQDWVMLGNHDTAPIFALLKSWPAAKREQWARHLAVRLRLERPERLASDGFFASAMLAELFVSRAENVSIFFADLFGLEERFNVPGLVDEANWSLRLPADFDVMYAERRARGAALDLELAVELALTASG